MNLAFRRGWHKFYWILISGAAQNVLRGSFYVLWARGGGHFYFFIEELHSIKK